MDVRRFAQLAVPGPTGTAVSAPFWKGAAEGRLMLQHCAVCAQWVFYQRRLCPHCWTPDLAWLQASGEGRLKTWSVQHRPGNPAWQPVAPYVVGLVVLAEGPTMLSHILAEMPALHMPLRVRFVRVGSASLPFFEPAL